MNACRSEKCKFALVGVIGMAPRTSPAVLTWSPDKCEMEWNRPPWKSAAETPDTPFGTRAFRYVFVIFTFVI